MAIPQILQQLGMKAIQQNPNYIRIKELINAAKSTGNSELMLERVINSNPQYQQTYQEMRQNGGTFKEAFMNKAKELGVDVNDVLNMLK